MEITNPVKAIRAKCLDCCCGSAAEIKQCPSEKCSLYPFRLGKNPYRTHREYTPEQREALRARLSQIRPNTTGQNEDEPAAEDDYTPEQLTAENFADSAEICPRV